MRKFYKYFVVFASGGYESEVNHKIDFMKKTKNFFRLLIMLFEIYNNFAILKFMFRILASIFYVVHNMLILC